jgi:hypothetical protein
MKAHQRRKVDPALPHANGSTSDNGDTEQQKQQFSHQEQRPRMQAAQQPEIMMDYPCNPYAPNSMADLRDGTRRDDGWGSKIRLGVPSFSGSGLKRRLAICAGSILRFNASRKEPFHEIPRRRCLRSRKAP